MVSVKRLTWQIEILERAKKSLIDGRLVIARSWRTVLRVGADYAAREHGEQILQAHSTAFGSGPASL